MRPTLTLAAALAAAALLAAGCGSDTDTADNATTGQQAAKQAAQRAAAGLDDTSQTAPEHQLASPPITDADDVVAVIDEDALITKRDVDRWIEIAQAGDPSISAKKARGDAMEFLTSAVYIEREAQRRGIMVSEAEITEGFEEQKDESFPTDARYQEFLEASAMTEADVRFRVEIDLLSTRIREQVVRGGSARAQQRRLDAFMAQFDRRWKSRSFCAVGYGTEMCEESQPPAP